MRSLLQRAVLAAALTALVAVSHAALPPLMNYTFTYEGSNEERLIRNAEMRALRAAVGQLYFSDQVLIAREILEEYLERNRGQFIAGVTILDRLVDQGRYRLRMDVAVFGERLQSELERFRFLYTPRPTPLTFVFLSETVDATRPPVPVARGVINDALQDAGLDVSEIAILSPDSRIDVGEAGPDPTLNPTLYEALTNAERAGVELMFSGQVTTTLTSNPDLYYDPYYYYETQLILRMFRVDTGELLGEAVVSDAGAHSDDATAREIAIRKTASEAISQLMQIYRARWPREVLNQADYLMMVTAIQPDELALFEAKLADLDAEAEVFRRSHYGGVACVNLLFSSEFAQTEAQERGELVNHLEQMDTPQLRIEDIDGRRITLSVVR